MKKQPSPSVKPVTNQGFRINPGGGLYKFNLELALAKEE
jgi:hypothetical protein